jgi:hypothetical protein
MRAWRRRSRAVNDDPALEDRRVAVIVRASDSELRFETPLKDSWNLADLHEIGRDLGDMAGIVPEGPETVWIGVEFPEPSETSGRGPSCSGRCDGLRPLIPSGTHRSLWRDIMHIVSTRRRRLFAAAVGVLLLAAGVAAAAWLLTAQGPSAGRVGALKSITVTAGPAPTGILPNASGDLSVHLDSPNELPLKVVSVTSAGDPFALMGSGALGSCSAQDLNDSLAVATKTLNTPVAVAPGQSDVVLPGVVTAGDIPSGCQNQSFTVAVRLSVST